MEKSQKQKQEASQLSEFQKLHQSINESLIEKFPNSIYKVSDGRVQIRSLEQIEELMREQCPNDRTTGSKGRGGNNMAENVKKSIQSILRKFLNPSLYAQFMDKYVKKYQLKSQKQNFLLYILFLHDFYFLQKINLQALENIKSQIIKRIEKYVQNSEIRKEQDTDRIEFHSKNLNQFQKFLSVDLDFCKPRLFADVRGWIQKQYLKKKAVCRQSELKVRRIIEAHPNLLRIFTDFEAQNMSKSSSQNSENITYHEMEIKQENGQNS